MLRLICQWLGSIACGGLLVLGAIAWAGHLWQKYGRHPPPDE